MQSLLDVGGAAHRIPPQPAATSTECSVDALERVVHATGAGADACFYAGQASTAAPEHLRYWLNPSVRARPTTATCEITNPGSPFFAPTSAGVLRLSATPLIADGRCFPTRCVVSLATSAQRLDGVAVRPVVLQEWSLVEKERVAAAAVAPGSEAFVCTAEVPLRTLYHVASLMGSTPTSMDDLRLYLQLRFTGCTDTSDTHRIAAVRLRYEHLGTAAQVLPVLQQRRRRTTAASPLDWNALDTTHHNSSYVEEVEVAVTSSTSSSLTSTPYTPPQRPPPPLHRAEQLLCIPCEDAESEFSSPPRRSATKPRPDAASRPHVEPQSTPRSRRQDSNSNDASTMPENSVTELVRVERTLRLPPPPPSSSSAAASHHRGATADHSTVLGGAPWPPRKTRTIVLAPSISPSLTSSSASPLSSPGSGGGSTPLSHDSASCSSTPLQRCGSEAPAERKSPLIAAQPQRRDAAVQDDWHLRDDDGGRRATETSAQGSQRPRRSASTDCPVFEASEAPSSSRLHSEASATERASRSGVQPDASTTAAVLWAATSLLGTAPWKLQSLQSSRWTSPAQSAPGSRASSRERSSDAPKPTVAEVKSTSASSLPPTAEWSISHAGERAWEPTVNEREKASCDSSQPLWWRTGFCSAAPPSASSAMSSFAQWRSSSVVDCSSTRVSPQLQPPRSAGMQSFSAAAPAPPPSPSLPTHTSLLSALVSNPLSVYVPRLSFRATTRKDALLPTSAFRPAAQQQQQQQQQQQPPPQPPPSQNRELWQRQTKGSMMTTQNVVADHGQSAAWARPLCAKSTAAAATWPAPSATLAAMDDMHSLKGPLSVVPAAWLEQQQQQQRRLPSSHNQREKDVEKTARRSAAASKASAGTKAPFRTHDKSPSSTSSPADASLDSAAIEVVPAPPSTPPPKRRALVHSTAVSSASTASSRSESAAAPQRAPPALPLQEEHFHNRHSRGPRVSAAAPTAATRRRDGQRRSRSAPVQRSVRASSPAPRSEAPLIPTAITVTKSTDELHVFPVLKHHASRNGVGRRRLVVRPVSSQHASGVRCFVALEKVRGVDQLRDTLGLGASGGGRSASSSCEIPLLDGDAVEVWAGQQAFNSGLIHKDKVHHVECCVVLRCNRQVVTALEMEAAEAVDQVSQLLLKPR